MMTAQDIINELQQFPPDTPVHFAFPSGDHWHTTLARGVKAIEEGEITYSQYHEEYRLLDEEEDTGAKTAIILR